MKLRKSARAILLNHQDQVLLLKHEDENALDTIPLGVLSYWATPGGGIEPGERPSDALKRELLEELSLENVVVGRQIGLRKVSLSLPEVGLVMSHESYFVCRVSENPELNQQMMSEVERNTIKTIKWWSREELHYTTEMHRPAKISELVENALYEDTHSIIMSE